MQNNGKIKIITINREYGACGRTVAKALSEALGIPWYDRDFVKITAEKSGYTEKEIKENSEELSIKDQLIDTIFSNASYTSAHDAVFRAQRRVMIEMAKSPCIIVGRTSNFIFRDAGIPSFDIFLHGDIEFRVKRAAELGENGNTDLHKYVESRDAKRQHHYKHYAKGNFGDYREYDMCLDISRLGVEATCDMLISLLKDRI